MTRTAFLLLMSAAVACAAPAAKHVIIVSMDGMSWDAVENDPVTKPLTALRALLNTGSHAAGVTPHFPSTTSNSHAALWTGAWGDVNGITGNSMLVTPRAEHRITERMSGFESTGLRAEPLWVAAARQGVPTVDFQSTQGYPFTPSVTGSDLAAPLTIVNGYQTKEISRDLFLHRKDVKDETCPPGQRASRKTPVCFTWNAGTVTLHGAMIAHSAVYDAIAVTAEGHTVEARYAPTETAPPERRELARFVSPGLFLADIPAVVYFRLFELSPDGSDFFLYQTPLREPGVYSGGKESREMAVQLLHEAGGFLANGPSHPLVDAPFELGVPAWKGGGGTAERRYLEISELLIRQSILQAQWLWKHDAPRLFLGYIPQPDEFEHSWKGVAKTDPAYATFRTWGYGIVNRAVEAFVKMRGPRDDIVFVSDHGMAPVTRQVRINAALEQAGLLTFDAKGRPDAAKTQALHLTNCIVVNTTDWKGGMVPPADRAAVVAKAEAALRAIRDPETGASPINRFFDTPADEARFGYGGPSGADFCFDYLPGYQGFDGASGPIVGSPVPARGVHGFMPERAEMQAILIAAGPGIPAGKEWQGIHSIDLAPLAAHLLGIQPPRDSRGHSPLL